MAYAQKAMRYVFQDSELDDQNYMLRRGGIPAKVEPKVFEVLVYLIRQRDRFVSREELFTQLWPDHVVSDAALTRCVAEARKAVGDNGVKQEVIRTQYTRGYRFIAEVVERSEAAAHLQPVSLVQSVGESVSHSLSVDERFVECHEDVLQTISYFPAVFAKRSWLQGLCAVVGVLVVAGSLFSHQPAPFVQFPAFVSVEPETARAGAPVTGGAYAQRIFGHLKTSLDASRYTQQGWDYYFRYTPETNARARRAFERAIALGPRVANAYIGLGWTSWLEWVWLWSHDPDLLEEAHGLASKALSLQPSAPSAHALLAVVYLAKKRYEPALTAASRAVELDRHDVGEIVILAEVLISTGQPQAALTVLKEARAHSCGREYASAIGHAYRVLGRYEEAIYALQEALTHNPNALFARTQLAVAYSQVGQDERAWAEMQTALRNIPSFSADEVKRRIAYKDQAEFQRFYTAVEKLGIQYRISFRVMSYGLYSCDIAGLYHLF